MTDTDALIRDLEAATEGSRELDSAIADLTIGPDRIAYGGDARYTRSLDAALTLVPEGQAWEILSGAIQAACVGEVSTGNPVTTAATPALALCIAALKARRGDRNESLCNST